MSTHIHTELCLEHEDHISPRVDLRSACTHYENAVGDGGCLCRVYDVRDFLGVDLSNDPVSLREKRFERSACLQSDAGKAQRAVFDTLRVRAWRERAGTHVLLVPLGEPPLMGVERSLELQHLRLAEWGPVHVVLAITDHGEVLAQAGAFNRFCGEGAPGNPFDAQGPQAGQVQLERLLVGEGSPIVINVKCLLRLPGKGGEGEQTLCAGLREAQRGQRTSNFACRKA